MIRLDMSPWSRELTNEGPLLGSKLLCLHLAQYVQNLGSGAVEGYSRKKSRQQLMGLALKVHRYWRFIFENLSVIWGHETMAKYLEDTVHASTKSLIAGLFWWHYRRQCFHITGLLSLLIGLGSESSIGFSQWRKPRHSSSLPGEEFQKESATLTMENCQNAGVWIQKNWKTRQRRALTTWKEIVVEWCSSHWRWRWRGLTTASFVDSVLVMQKSVPLAEISWKMGKILSQLAPWSHPKLPFPVFPPQSGCHGTVSERRLDLTQLSGMGRSLVAMGGTNGLLVCRNGFWKQLLAHALSVWISTTWWNPARLW